jgi:hypothetical protein
MTSVLSAILIMACSGGEPGSPIADANAQMKGPMPPGVIRLQPTQIIDRSGFEKPLVAYTAMAPVGWQAQGGVVWNTLQPCAPGDYVLNWSLVAPDGVSALAMVAKPTWKIVRNNLPYQVPRGPCETASWTTAKEFIEATARQSSPQGRILDYRARPDLTRETEYMLKATAFPSSDLMQVRQYVEAGEILIATNVNGREARELIQAMVMFSEVRLADVMNPGRIGQQILDAIPLSVVFARAPAGQLDLRLADAVGKSLRKAPEWSERVFRHNFKKQQDNFEAMIAAGKISADRLQAMRAQHEARMSALGETKRISDQINDQKNLVSDRMQRENVEVIRGVETYHEPVDGGVVQLDNTYDHAWRVRDGTYLLTSDPNFRPGLIGLEGQQLQKVQ